MIYIFGAFRLDTGQFELTRATARPVHVEPLVFDLLALFVANPGAVIDRDRMIAEVWDGRIVSEATLSTAVKSARRALGDSGDGAGLIETVRGRGFRFRARSRSRCRRAPVAAGRRRAPATPRGAARAARRRSRCCRSSRLGDARRPTPGSRRRCPHEVILALSRLRWLFVIARGSSFRFRGPDADIGRGRPQRSACATA